MYQLTDKRLLQVTGEVKKDKHSVVSNNVHTLNANLCDEPSSFVSEETLYPGRMMDAVVCISLSAAKHTTPHYNIYSGSLE